MSFVTMSAAVKIEAADWEIGAVGWVPQVAIPERPPLVIRTAGTLRSSRVSSRTAAGRTFFGDLREISQGSRERIEVEASKGCVK